MNRIELRVLSSKYVDDHPVILVDGTPLDLLLKAGSAHPTKGVWSGYEGLVPAIFALADDSERSGTSAAAVDFTSGRRLVPWLVCPDCCDLNCTVIMADTVVDGGRIEWRGLGRLTAERALAASFEDVDWLPNIAPLRFERHAYISAVESLTRSGRLWTGSTQSSATEK